MKNPKPLTNSESEVRELTQEDFQRGMNFSELHKNLQMNLKFSQKDELALLTRNQRNLHFIWTITFLVSL
jgi:hypothetical protein